MRIFKRVLITISIVVCFSLSMWFVYIGWGIKIPILSPIGLTIGGKFIITPIANTYARICSYIYWRQFTCDKLVSLNEIMLLMIEHQDVVKEIAQIYPDTVIVVPEKLKNSIYSTTFKNIPSSFSVMICVRGGGNKCPDKGYIEISGGNQNRIKKILKGRRFFGVPCHLVRD